METETGEKEIHTHPPYPERLHPERERKVKKSMRGRS